MGVMPIRKDSFDLPGEAALFDAFRTALEAARGFEGATAPNPPVGCVLLDARGNIVAVGAHERAGLPHAEAIAIAKADADGRLDDVASVVVTLEPCNHTGRTPPCAEAILRTGAREVWIGAMDPNPNVSGGGAERLRQAGLDVRGFAELALPGALQLSEDAARLIAPFAKLQSTGLPYVTIKQALDENGSMIPPKGKKTFTSQESLTLAHQLRRCAGAVLTGSGTILADSPEFTVRHVPDFEHAKRRLVILDRRERVSADYLAAAERRGFEVWIEGDLEEALGRLGEAGVMDVLVEAGPDVTGAALNADIWDAHVVVRKHAGGPDTVRWTYNDQTDGVR